MEHPIVHLTRVTKFLDSLIQEHGDYLFMGLVSFLVLVWILVRRLKHPVHDISVVILPLGQPPRSDPEPELPPAFEEDPDR